MSALISIGRRRPSSVALVAVDWTRPHDPRLPLGHASLLATLQHRQVPATSLVYAANSGDVDHLVGRIVDDVVASGAAIVALGAFVWNVHIVRAVIARVKASDPGRRIVVGGPEVTYAPVEELGARFPGADLFVRGAGEEALVDIAHGRMGGVGVVSPTGGVGGFAGVDLAMLPSPFLTGVTPIVQGQAMVRWETARGCSYVCSFCAHPGAPEQRVIRRRRIDDLRAEIALFVERGVQRVNVLDPLFNANVDHAIDVLDALIAAGFLGELTFQCRFLAMKNRVDELLDRFAALDVELEFGLQTTDEVVGDAVRRRSELDLAASTIVQLRRRGIRHSVSLIYGLPLQTLESFQASVQWCIDQGVPQVRCFPLSLLVGTALWHDRDRLGLVEGRAPGMGEVPIVVETPWMSRADMREASALSAAMEARNDQPRRLAG